MIEEAYPYFPIKDNLLYTFTSEGVKGEIYKIIIFTPIGGNKWNLAFGDWRNDDIDDKIMTNNQDVVRVIGTVAKVAFEFLKNNQDATLVIKPVDEKRKKLYNIVFQRHHKTLIEMFQIIGFIGEMVEIYSPVSTYDIFELSLKFK
jgi:hypothetical protein